MSTVSNLTATPTDHGHTIAQDTKRFLSRPFIVTLITSCLLVGFTWAFIALSFDDGQLTITTQTLSPQLSQKLLDPRLGKVGPILVVGFAAGIATITFQTITGNRILTPSIMGIDALFVLIQTALVFFIGGTQLLAIPPPLLFSIETVLLLGTSSVLFYFVFIRSRRSLYTLALVGIITGTFFRSITSLFQSLIDPQEFLIAQDRTLARFEIVNPTLFITTGVLCLLAIGIIWAYRYQLDLLTLGKDSAISLGLSYSPAVLTLLICCALLVSATTALVGPLTFLGLLVANMAVSLAQTYKHAWLLPISGLIGATTLISAQFVLERLMGMGTVVTVVIELIGGLLFLISILKGMFK